MGIDRIGKGGAPPAAPDVDAKGPAERAGKADKADKAFSLERPDGARDATQAAEAARVDATSPLARLRAGEIDVERYVDLKVDEATRHLPPLGPAKLDEIKKMLREQVVTDPGLADLVRAATGSAPSAPED